MNPAVTPWALGHAPGNPPSDWVCRWAPLIPPGARVLDLACGSGRHLRWLAERGWRVTGVDRDAATVAPLAGLADILVADLEDGPWPLEGRQFDGIVVTNYLWRPTLPRVLEALAPGGVLIYETFGTAHAAVGRPSRPEFLLRPGELLEVARELRVVAYEDGLLEGPTRAVQRLCAINAGEPKAGTASGAAPSPPRLQPPAPR
jgi:SAM-dependent methyltransferase